MSTAMARFSLFLWIAIARSCRWNPLGDLRSPITNICTLPIDDNAASWAPWTHRPTCAISKPDSDYNKYCTYTDSNFRGGVGISFITHPEVGSVLLEAIQEPIISWNSPRYPCHPGTSSELSYGNASLAYKIVDLPGRGKGVVAARKIEESETIVMNVAAIVANVQFAFELTAMRGEKLLNQTADQLPDPSVVYGLAMNRGGSPVADVMRTNAYAVDINEQMYFGLFPVLSRINHACNPNAYTRFSQRTMTMEVKAYRDIQAGEEITTSYLEYGLTHELRQERIISWGFKCSCSLCTASPDEITASDERRERIAEIREELDNSPPKSVLAIERFHYELMSLVKEEGLLVQVGEDYELLMRAYIDLEDWLSARRYASLALKNWVKYKGEHVDRVAVLQKFLRDVDMKIDFDY